MYKYILSILLLAVSLNYAQNKKVPNSKLEDIDGKKVQLKSYVGKSPVLISFWATWCKPCQEELIEVQKIYNDFKDKGLKVVAISIDNEKSAAKVKPYIKSKKYSFTVLSDINSDAARDFYVQDVPNSFIVDAKGNIVYSHRGYKKGDELELRKKIEGLIK